MSKKISKQVILIIMTIISLIAYVGSAMLSPLNPFSGGVMTVAIILGIMVIASLLGVIFGGLLIKENLREPLTVKNLINIILFIGNALIFIRAGVSLIVILTIF